MAWGSGYSPDFRVASIVGAATGTTAANDRRLVESLNGTNSFIADAFDTGRYAIRFDPSAAAANMSLADMVATPRYQGWKARMRLNCTNFSTDISTGAMFGGFVASTTTDNIRVNVAGSGAPGHIRYSFNNGTTYTNDAGSFVFVENQVYRVEMFVDWNTGTTHTLKIRVDGVEVLNVTGGASTVTGTTIRFGNSASATGITMDYSDLVSYNDVAQYGAMDDWRVIGLEPTADGTHSMTANDFQDAASNNLSNSTTNSWTWVDDAPAAAPDTTAFVQQVVTRSTSYMEHQLRAMPSGYGNPVLVCLAAAMHPVAAATANTVAFRLNSGGNVSAEAAIDTSVASNTLEYRKHHYLTEPSTAAAWTTAMVQAPLRSRFGYSSDAAPPPALDSIMGFVVAPVSAAATSFVIPRRDRNLSSLRR